MVTPMHKHLSYLFYIYPHLPHFPVYKFGGALRHAGGLRETVCFLRPSPAAL